MEINFNSNIVNTIESNPKINESIIQLEIKNNAVNNILNDNISNYIQVDTHKYCIPIDVEGKIRYVEINFIAKKSDYDVEKAHNEYMVKLEQKRLKEREKALKKKEK